MGWGAWIRTVEIEPAIDAAEVSAREHAVESLLRTGCRVFHVDTAGLDGRQAGNAVAWLAPLVHSYEGLLDVHVVGNELTDVVLAGADSVTFDAAAVDDVSAAVWRGRDTGVRVGVGFPAGTAAGDVAASAGAADLVHVAGATVEQVRRLADALPSSVTIQVEGGISFENVRSHYLAGARLLVVERIFEREDLPRAYRRLVQALA